jgi:hypothetical protein
MRGLSTNFFHCSFTAPHMTKYVFDTTKTKYLLRQVAGIQERESGRGRVTGCSDVSGVSVVHPRKTNVRAVVASRCTHRFNFVATAVHTAGGYLTK